VDQSEVFAVAEQPQSPAQHRVVGRLAAVAGDGPPLALAGHGERDVEFIRVANR